MYSQAEINDILDSDCDFMFFGDDNFGVYMLLLDGELKDISEEELALNFRHQYCRK